ncbi:MAG: hypothetical protein Q4F95_02685 [Oscillospiraceae bacterium]|nr:hypothetical protein [Oscillospiraceae bacterium]
MDIQTSIISSVNTVPYAVELTLANSPREFCNGNTITFQGLVKNTGTQPLADPAVYVCLTDNDLQYKPDSVSAYLYDENHNCTALMPDKSLVGNKVKYKLNKELPVNQELVFTFSKTADLNMDKTIYSVYNTFTFEALQNDPSGNLFTKSDKIIVNRKREAFFASADKSSVMPGDTLTYTFVIENYNFSGISLTSLTNDLPKEFVVADTIKSETYDPSRGDNLGKIYEKGRDFTVDDNNKLLIIADTSIEIPSYWYPEPGQLTIWIPGTILA